MVSDSGKEEVGMRVTGTGLSLQLKAAKKEGRLSEALLLRESTSQRQAAWDKVPATSWRRFRHLEKRPALEVDNKRDR